MNWIFIGTLLGALVTSQHATREACEGKAVVLREKGVIGKCEDRAPDWTYYGTQGAPIQMLPTR